MSTLVITGTDTGVGKTVACAALAALAVARGDRVAVVKPAQTGVGPGESGDLDDVRRLAGVDDLHELARYPEPLAPATAARRAAARGAGTGLSDGAGDADAAFPAGAAVAADSGAGAVRAAASHTYRVPAGPGVCAAAVAGAVRALGDRDLVLVEGAGGALVRLTDAGDTILDVAALLDAPALVVARAGLGTLNATALTCEAARARGVRVAGVVVGAWPAEPDLAARCNLEDLPSYAGAPLVGRLPDGAGALDPTSFLAVAREGLDGVLPHRTEVRA